MRGWSLCPIYIQSKNWIQFWKHLKSSQTSWMWIFLKLSQLCRAHFVLADIYSPYSVIFVLHDILLCTFLRVAFKHPLKMGEVSPPYWLLQYSNLVKNTMMPDKVYEQHLMHENKYICYIICFYCSWVVFLSGHKMFGSICNIYVKYWCGYGV